MREIHILSASVALLAGAFALFSRKGSSLHRWSGRLFALAMFTMTGSAFVSAGFLRPTPTNVVAASTTFYLVATGWLTVRRSAEQPRRILIGLALFALAAAAYAFSLGIGGMGSPDGRIDGIPYQAMFVFGSIGLVAVLLDARLLRAGRIDGAHRIARHLWRMTLAMWIATASFFLGQAKVIPEPFRNLALLAIPVLLVAGVGIYSLARLLFRRQRAMLAATTAANAGSARSRAQLHSGDGEARLQSGDADVHALPGTAAR